MRASSLTRLAVVLLLVAGLGGPLVAQSAGPAGGTAARPGPTARHRPPLVIENVGQFDPAARFLVRGVAGGQLWLTNDGLWLSLAAPSSADRLARSIDPADEPAATAPGRPGVHLHLRFSGAAASTILEPFGRQATTVSYFLGNDPARWRPDVPVWSGVRYRDLYPGLDLVVGGAGGHWDWRWEITGAEGAASLAQARLQIDGAERLALADGWALLATAIGPVSLPLPTLASPAPSPEVAGQTIIAPVAAARPTAPTGLTTAAVGDLRFSSFLGGSAFDYAYAVAVTSGGNLVVAGTTGSPSFPTTPGAVDRILNEGDLFVTVFNPQGTTLLASTFLGGGQGELVNDLALAPDGSIVLTGFTSSSDFPTTADAFDRTFAGSNNGFIARLSADTSSLLASTLLGDNSQPQAVHIDQSGAVFVAGWTVSTTFPTTAGAFDVTFNGSLDGFATKLNPTLSTLLYSTFVGGADIDRISGLALADGGRLVIAGDTTSADFPTTAGAFSWTPPVNGDAFVARLSADAGTLDFSTLLGGNNVDELTDLAVDPTGAIVVAGRTRSTDFPTTSGAHDTSHGGSDDLFVTRLTANGSGLLWSTFIGGTDQERTYALAVDGGGGVAVVGQTRSTDFPVTSDAVRATFAGGAFDGFISRLNAAGTTLTHSTYLGGSEKDIFYAVASASDGEVVVVGETESADFPVTASAYDPSFNGAADAVVLVLQVALPPPPTATPTPTVTTAPPPTRTPTPTPTAPNGTPPSSPSPTPIATPTLQPGALTPTATPTSTVPVGGSPPSPLDPPLPNDRPFAHPAFQARWAVSDAGAQGRTYVYGPAPFTDGRVEPYADSPGGQRLVQYFDKARMELYDPATGLVTAGLLAVELISGRQQNGDATFQQRLPGRVSVVGDPDNPFPYYADLDILRASAVNQVGQVANRRYLPGGTFSTDPAAANDPQALLTGYDPETGHNLPRAFADFRNDPRFGRLLTIGLAITEPVWVEVRVAGVPKRVLVQAFERRVLTYTPDNPDGFQVEYGNIGRHYHAWRYGP